MNRKQSYLYLTAILCLLSGLTFFAVSAYLQMKAEESNRELLRFQSSALQAEVSIQRAITSKLDVLYAMRDAFAVSTREISREQFRVLAESVYQRTGGIQALEWIPRVKASERRLYEAKAQLEGFSEFMIKEPDARGNMVRAGESDEYFPVFFVEPLKGNEKALGFNLASNPARKAALKAALNLGTMVASSRIRLVQETGSQNGILVFYPQTAGLDLVEARKNQNLFLAVFRVQDMFISAFPGGYDPNLHIYIYDVEDRWDPSPLAVLSNDPAVNTQLPVHNLSQEFSQTASSDIQVGGRTWKVVAVPSTPVRTFDKEHLAWMIAFMVLAVALTMSAYILSRIKYALEVRASEERHRVMSQRLNAILENTLDGILTINHHGVIQSFNKAAQSMFGYTHVEVLGKPVTLLLPDIDWQQERESTQEPENTEMAANSRSGKDFKGKRKSGGSFYIRLGISEVPVQSDPIYVGVIQDITEQKKIEALKDSFISTVNHELRTPLTSIQGGVELLKKLYQEALPEKAQSLLHITEKNTRRIIRLVNDILDLQKMEAGEMVFKYQPVSLQSLIESAVSENQLYAGQYKVSTKVLPFSDDTFILADADRVIQVLTNLLSNAIKFSPEGSTVEVSVKSDPESKKVRVSIRDQGPGIPPEFKDKLFDRFTQASSVLTRKESGTGLGLSISKSIIERHGGAIGVSSREGSGATFYFELDSYEHSSAMAT
ncbi:CHASE domain-containing protein [Endozoicomonas arenosclerae]|uniref:CHASE domain-containing protein n=1 Tax=Endozoicomonas arenosclerae TaxID=1633495 RepID=UPI000780FB29|nr:CHASE domain-containing protein [Endozoicomonas arenosclerae]